MKTTRISLPRDAGERLDERFDWYVGDPDGYGHSPEEIAACQEIRKAPIKRYKTRIAFYLPYYGPDHVVTRILDHALLFAIEDARQLDETLSRQQEGVLQKMRIRWVKEGVFGLDQTPKPKPKPVKLSPETVAHRAEVERIAQEHVRHACKLLNKAASPIATGAAFGKSLEVRFTWSRNRTCSRGGFSIKRGIPYVSLFFLDKFPPGQEEYDWLEYGHIASLPSIGSVKGPMEVALATLVAHEMAHAVQGFACSRPVKKMNGITRKLLFESHGQGWQEIYRYLRINWVNQLPGYQSLAGTGDE